MEIKKDKDKDLLLVVFDNNTYESNICGRGIELFNFMEHTFQQANLGEQKLILLANTQFMKEHLKEFDWSNVGNVKKLGFDYTKNLSKQMMENQTHYVFANNLIKEIIRLIYKKEINYVSIE